MIDFTKLDFSKLIGVLHYGDDHDQLVLVIKGKFLGPFSLDAAEVIQKLFDDDLSEEERVEAFRSFQSNRRNKKGPSSGQ